VAQRSAMGLQLCNDFSPFDFRDACVRTSWSALIPVVIVFLFCMSSLPVPGPVQRPLGIIKAPFETYMTLPEAEALDANASTEGKLGADEDMGDDPLVPVPLWRSLVLSWIGLVQTLVWLGVGSYLWVVDSYNLWNALCPVLISASWLYATARPIFNPMATPPMDLFSIYCVHIVAGSLLFGGVLYDHNISGLPLPPSLAIVALVFNLVAIMVLLAVVVNMPMGIPSKRVRKENIVSIIPLLSARKYSLLIYQTLQGLTVSPEDYTTLFNWITFHWVYPLVKRVRSSP